MSFQTNITIFTANKCEKMSIQDTVLRFEPTTFGTWVSSHNILEKGPHFSQIKFHFVVNENPQERWNVKIAHQYLIRNLWLNVENSNILIWWPDSILRPLAIQPKQMSMDKPVHAKYYYFDCARHCSRGLLIMDS